ncbi:MAG: D-alanyl-D-alanine carboxypeptidase family protein [Eubacteriales bacterium]
MFSADAFKASQGFLDTGKDDNENYRYYYNIDVSNYLEFIDPADASEYLMLVNKTVMLRRDYVPSDLTTITKNVSPMHSADYYQMRSCAVQALYAMLDSMIADGVTDIYVSSTYRSYERQEYLFNYYLQRENGDEEAVLKYSARPGTSEHQSGLCLDFTTASIDYGVLNVFENTDAFDWLSKNAYKFGFILRYPSDKVDITGYTYEPWHYRFVGRTAATEIYNSGICFEEYIATLNK